jgi:hypothetical protein
MIRILTFTSVLIIALTVPNNLNAQDYSQIPLKEQYEDLGQQIISTNTLYSIQPAQENNGNYLGEPASFFLMSLLKMYKITGDKAYLIRFVSFSYIIQMARNDEADPNNHFGWVTSEDAMYQDGLIIMAMAEFVYLVRNNQILSNTLLPSSTIVDIRVDRYPPAQYNTYGLYASWLGFRVEQTLDYYYCFWADDYRCYATHSYPGSSDFAQQVNMQAPFGCALFYMGYSDIPQNADYLHKATYIARHYFGDVNDESDCYKFLGHWYGNGFNTLHDVYVHQPGNDSYIWWGWGWQPETCASQHGDYHNDYEDLCHGILTLQLPLATHNFLTWSDGAYIFGDDEMTRYRNTFFYNVLYGNYSCPDIHSGVDGDDHITYRPTWDYDGPNNNIMINASLAWMPFHDFDGSTSDVYTLLMNKYLCYFYETTSNLQFSIGYLGLSDIITAQWEKECTDLTLYNRRVVYDQDFRVKGNLTIDPTATTDTAYADPIIPFDFKFIVYPNVTTNMVSGKSIVLKPETYIDYESNFHAYINSSICTNGKHFTNSNFNMNKNNNLSSGTIVINSKEDTMHLSDYIPPQDINKSYDKNSLSVSPNPFNDLANINFSVKEKCSVTLKIIDQYGIAVFNELNNVQTEKGNYSIKFNGNNLSQGLYYCILQINGQIIQTKKIILIK